MEEAIKRCSRCGQEKPLSEFHKCKSSKDGHQHRCKECQSRWHMEHRERRNEKAHLRWALATAEQRAAEYETDKKWREANPEKVKERGRKTYQKHAEKHRAYASEYYKTHKDYFADYMREWRQSDPMFRLSCCIRSGINSALAGNKNGRHWEDLVGYTLDDLKHHLESQFSEDMTWENMGRKGWTIDHAKPQAAFTFTSPDDPQFKECWSLDNLQPMWFRENCSKNAKYQGIDYRYYKGDQP